MTGLMVGTSCLLLINTSNSNGQEGFAGTTCNDSCEYADFKDCTLVGGKDENGNDITVICHDMRKYGIS